MNARGQALVEVAVFFLLLAVLLACLLGFTRWITLRQKLLLAAREGALLYSSGRMTVEEVQEHIRGFLRNGSPVMDVKRLEFVSMGPCPGWRAKVLELDQITLRYSSPSPWYRYLGIDPTLEETCIIKHASHYGPPLQKFFGPPLPY